ncbi:hypothetical protein [Chryseobacterium sp. MEBOG07]|uniref:hypothetical protein n=1 Tax=Chryseobacterium sp. MEBOG07 TaxID=2879939 RepID=UPI001F20774E|nr:hypothetical protein [Chryseobacterium sp. MEBOG07]UKB81142.1 hypothetical protein LF886_09195 [Chryseobacterium sp. MEBOG07]
MMKKYLTYITLLGAPLFWGQNKTVEKTAYQQSWLQEKQGNEALAFDADIQLSDAEIALDKKIFQIRKQFISETEAKKVSLYNSSFTEIKPMIEKSKLFEIFQTMPKGGLLHTHSGGITDVKWVISAARKYQECYVYDQKDNDQFITGQLAFLKKEKFRTDLSVWIKN